MSSQMSSRVAARKGSFVKLLGAVLALGTLAGARDAMAGFLLADFTPVNETAASVDFKEATAGVPNTRHLTATTGFRGTALGGSNGVIFRSQVPVLSVAGGSIVNGFYVFGDVSVTLTSADGSTPGFQVQGGATTIAGVINQPIGRGRFTFISSAASGSKTLLTGTFDVDPQDDGGTIGGVISGVRFRSTGGIFAGNVAYDGGAVYDSLVAIPGATATGDATFNALLVTPSFNTSSGFLSPFTARVQGQFSTPVIPEPSFAVLALGPAGLTMLRRRRA